MGTDPETDKQFAKKKRLLIVLTIQKTSSNFNQQMSSNFDQKNIVKLQSKVHLPNFNPKKHLQTLIKKHLQISIKRHLQTSIKRHLQTSIKKTYSNFKKNIFKFQSKNIFKLQSKKHLQISSKKTYSNFNQKESSNFDQKNIVKLQSKEHLPNSNPKKNFSTGKFPQISLTLRFQTVSPTWRNSAGAVSNRMVFWKITGYWNFQGENIPAN